eukprot:6191851-Pleurochrysis_carterae.AAC.1
MLSAECNIPKIRGCCTRVICRSGDGAGLRPAAALPSKLGRNPLQDSHAAVNSALPATSLPPDWCWPRQSTREFSPRRLECGDVESDGLFATRSAPFAIGSTGQPPRSASKSEHGRTRILADLTSRGLSNAG